MYLYSPSKKGFYHSLINHDIPDDCVELTENEYKSYLNSVNNGKELILDDDRLIVVDRSPPKTTWEEIRTKRNALLKNCDYTQLPDWPGNKVAWFNYRKELRELPQKFEKPEDVVWPAPPSE